MGISCSGSLDVVCYCLAAVVTRFSPLYLEHNFKIRSNTGMFAQCVCTPSDRHHSDINCHWSLLSCQPHISGWLSPFNDNMPFDTGVIDFAGSGVVHMVGGAFSTYFLSFNPFLSVR